jgi:hypothetical protein
VELRNGRLRLEIDERTGSIARVADAFSGDVHFDARHDLPRLGRLFRVLLPIDRWSSHAADSWRSPPPELAPRADGIDLHWADLAAPTGPSGIEAWLEVRLPPGTSETTLRLRLANHRHAGEVTDVLFPWLGGWRSGAAGDAIVLGGARRVDAHAFPMNRGMTFSRWHQRESFTYPIDLYAPWLDLSGRDGGVGILDLGRLGRNRSAFIENLAGYGPGIDLSIGLGHFTRTRPGETWTSDPVAIVVHSGDWHASADRYLELAEAWLERPPTPTWARRAVGFQNVLFRGFDGTPIRQLTELPEVARVGLAAGVEHLCVWDYVLLGEYGKLHDVPLHGFGEADRRALEQGLATARRLGARLSSLQNWRLVKPTSSLFREQAHAEVCLRYDGTPFVEEYCGSLTHAQVITTHVGPMVHPVDMRVPSVRERARRLLDATLDMGFDSHFHDQPFENLPSYRPDVADGPDGAHAGTVSLLRELRHLLHERSPEGILMGEYCDIIGAQAVDLWMSWYTDFEDLRRTCYSVPSTLNSWVVDAEAAQATRAFGIGAQLCLTTHGGEGHLGDVPEFAAHVARLGALRARARRVTEGRFRDRTGLDVAEIDGPVSIAAFTSAEGPAVVVASPGEPGRAIVRLDRAGLAAASPSGPGRLLRLDADDRAVDDPDVLDIVLARDEAAVWYP